MRALVLVPVLIVAACSQLAAPKPEPQPEAVAPPPRPAEAIVPVAGGRDPGALDTTTAAERAAATAPAAGGTLLGTAVASLGSPAEQGFWLETPLVTAAGPGRVVLAGSGKSVQVELRPAGAAAGNRLSLAAMRALGVTLTDLPEIEVFSG
jgi:hypothetical protein